MKIPLLEEEWEILLGADLFTGGENLKWGAFDHSNLFQIKKHHCVNIEHQPACTKKMKLKRKWC